jgi:transposase InsO family protein
VRVLNEICSQLGLPRTIKADNGREFTSKAMDKWAHERGIEIDFNPSRQRHRERRCKELQRATAPELFERALVLIIGRRVRQDRGPKGPPQRESSPLCARSEPHRRIRAPLLPAGSDGDVKGVGSSYSRAAQVPVQGQDDYDLCNPHGSLGHLTPSDFATTRSGQPKDAASPSFKTVRLPGKCHTGA